MIDHALARTNMVESQLRPNRVTDLPVLDAFRSVKREEFVPARLQAASYADEDLPLGGGRWLIEPMVLGRLVQEAGVRKQDRALVVGCACGYSAAIVSRLAAHVVALDPGPIGGPPGVIGVAGPIEAGVPEHAPYDVILLAGAVSRIPPTLFEQLAEGGRLVGIVRPSEAPGQAILVERIGGALSRRILFDAAAHRMPGFAASPAFSF